MLHDGQYPDGCNPQEERLLAMEAANWDMDTPIDVLWTVVRKCPAEWEEEVSELAELVEADLDPRRDTYADCYRACDMRAETHLIAYVYAWVLTDTLEGES